MLETGFTIILGFSITSTFCGFIADNSKADRILFRAMIYLLALSFILALSNGEAYSVLHHAQNLAVMSFLEKFPLFVLGAFLAIIVQLMAEGHIYDLWVRFHPFSAPTPEARFGQRALPAGREKPIAATLVGTSTGYLNAELDLRTDTLIRLCFFSFEDRGALTLSRIESDLRLGTGRRQKAFHKHAAGIGKRPPLKRILHRYIRSINGSSRLSLTLFGDLCRLAQDTGNRDRTTVSRLDQIGRALSLPEEEIRRLISGGR